MVFQNSVSAKLYRLYASLNTTAVSPSPPKYIRSSNTNVQNFPLLFFWHSFALFLMSLPVCTCRNRPDYVSGHRQRKCEPMGHSLNHKAVHCVCCLVTSLYLCAHMRRCTQSDIHQGLREALCARTDSGLCVCIGLHLCVLSVGACA